MKIHVTYMSQLRRLAGRSSEEIVLDEGGRLADLLRRIVETRGPDFRAVAFDADGEPHLSLLAFRSEEQISADVVLADGDRVTLLTPMAGG